MLIAFGWLLADDLLNGRAPGSVAKILYLLKKMRDAPFSVSLPRNITQSNIETHQPFALRFSEQIGKGAEMRPEALFQSWNTAEIIRTSDR
ncbi:MAG: hypothetical protein KDD65_05040 [Bacteroidetes bacterium]|nr:hypothetical protein [Bacteroidota bacterium]